LILYVARTPYISGGDADDFDYHRYNQLKKNINEGRSAEESYQTINPSAKEFTPLESYKKMYEEARTVQKSEETPSGQPKSDDYFDLNKFEQLLGRLEASKGRQQRQKSLEGRRDIFAQGLASMMSNF